MSRAGSALATILFALAACGDNHGAAPSDAASDASSDAALPPGGDAPPADAPLADAAPPPFSFTEAFSTTAADTGHWILTTNPLRMRTVEPTGGNPDGFLYAEVSTRAPTWQTASTRYQPGNSDDTKRDSAFVGDFYAADIRRISVDLLIQQIGSWTPDRTVTLHLASWATTGGEVAFDATYSFPDMEDPPAGWNHYDFVIAARSSTIPAGWIFSRGDGTPGTDADWATFMHQIDLVAFGYWKPDFNYPALGLWQLGIDNIQLTAQP